MVEQLHEQQEVSQNDQNEALLAQSELGIILHDAYLEATNLDPRLREMKIVPIEDPEEKRYGYATPHDRSESGKHEVHVRLNDLDATLAYYEQAMRDFPLSIEMVAQRLHIDPSQVTPQLLYVQSILHEMGHVTEHMDYEDNMDEFRKRNKQEAAALPLGRSSLTKLMDPTSPLRQQVDLHWDELSTKHGVDSIEGLARVQGEAYRNMTSETVADNFATSVFELNPQMYDQLIHGNVETYRNYPMAA